MPVLSKIHPVKCCDFANRQRFPVCFSQFSVIFPEFQRNNTPEGDHQITVLFSKVFGICCANSAAGTSASRASAVSVWITDFMMFFLGLGFAPLVLWGEGVDNC